MIPLMYIIEWANTVPWSDQRQVEQDLIISRAIVALFSDEFLVRELRFRGGTALHKLHFPVPLRYSEDIDLVRTTHGPIRPILDRARDILEPWLGAAAFDQSPVAPKLRFRVQAEDGSSTAPLRLKVEINTRDTEACDQPQSIRYAVENRWFTGQAEISTYTREEILATKFRALMQRDKGRDLFDLAHALRVFDALDTARVIRYFLRYLERAAITVSRAEAEQRMFRKLSNPRFLTDIRPLLAPAVAESITDEAVKEWFADVFMRFVTRLPGDPWSRTEETAERLGIVLAETS